MKTTIEKGSKDSGFLIIKEIAKYFMDFLETDFHKHRLPRRSIKTGTGRNFTGYCPVFLLTKSIQL
jgi:hypothetical protein